MATMMHDKEIPVFDGDNTMTKISPFLTLIQNINFYIFSIEYI